MRNHVRRGGWIFILLVLTVFGDSQGKNFNFSNPKEVAVIGMDLEILTDVNSEFSPAMAWASDGYAPATQSVPNLDVTDHTFWIKFSITNQTQEEALQLELAYATIDEVSLYQITDGNPRENWTSGNNYPFKSRNYLNQDFIFDLDLKPGQRGDYLLKLKSTDQVMVPLSVGTREKITQRSLNQDLIFGLYAGIILVMFLYNLFLGLSVQQGRIYLFYVLYILFVGLTQATVQGYSFRFIYPGFPWLAVHSIFLLPGLTGTAAILFQRAFLETSNRVPKLDKGFITFVIGYVICIGLALGGQYTISYRMLNAVALLQALYMIVVGWIIYRQGYRPAIIFLIAWSIFLVGIIIFVIKDLGVLPYNGFTSYILIIGSAIEVVLLSFALADSINNLRKEKEASQAETLTALRENERIVREQNILLEEKVKERTSELENSNSELFEANETLKQTQAQLVNAEKMASLGQLTAGIAHEINNPINFVASSVEPLKRDIADILEVLSRYEEVHSASDIQSKLAEIQELKDDLETDYLIDEVGSLLKGISEGAVRTSEIVKGLRNFSRVDETDLKKIKLHDGIDSTLIVLKNQLRDTIQLHKEYGDLPMIECYPGRLNQVFMNIISNAAQAIYAKEEQNGQGDIKIKTWARDNEVIVEISDNGIGMSEEVKNKIFEPFFTTKDVGEGTGLGMSISYGIIEDHNGRIEVDSEPGKGTKFTIYIPERQPQ